MAFKEKKTKECLIRFLKEHTNLSVVDCGQWFYACHEVANANRVVGFRADYDAVEGADGKAGHYCEHDGHAATLATFGIDEIIVVKNNLKIILAFKNSM